MTFEPGLPALRTTKEMQRKRTMALAQSAARRRRFRLVALAAAVAAFIAGCAQDPDRKSNLSPANTTFGKGPNSWR